MLHNDLRSALDELHKLLNDIHGAARGFGTSSAPAIISSNRPEGLSSAPFALVQAVEPNSPAASGNLHVGDKVIKFGDAQGAAGLTTLQTRLQVFMYSLSYILLMLYWSWTCLVVHSTCWERWKTDRLLTSAQGHYFPLDRKKRKSAPDAGLRVQEYKGVPQQVIVQRRGEAIDLQITPQSWSGKGLLGGTLVPL